MLFSLLFASLSSCNNNTETPKEEPKKTADTVAATAPPPVEVFKPINAVLIKHTVADYAKWKTVFDADSSFRKAAGLNLMGPVARGLENKNMVEIALAMDDIKKAKEFTANPRLKEVMQKGGVISAPRLDYYSIVRYDPMVDKQNLPYVEIAIKVKDFDTWVKAFDAEGKAKRETEGTLDLALAHGIDDPNTVVIVFAITNMEKFKTAMASEGKKKIIMDSGVIGKPEMSYFQNEK